MSHLNTLENKFFGLDSQQKQLDSILSEFCATSKGASCVLSGRRGTGKTALLNALLPVYFSSDEVVYEDGDLCTNTNQPLKKLSDMGLVDGDASKENNRLAEQKSQRLVIVIDHFEYFTSKISQSYLYTLLNGTHRYPWLVILIGSSQDCVLVPPLEKRVYSRLSKSVISFNARFTDSEMFDAFFLFLDCFLGHKNLAEMLNVPRSEWELSRFFRRCDGLGELKKVLTLLAIVRPLRRAGGESILDTFNFCADCVCPSNEAADVLRDIPLRQLCLLNCCLRLQKLERRFEVLCRDVITEYKRFLNVYRQHSLIAEDAALYKDIEELIAAGAITYRSSVDVGDLQFRRVSLNVEEETVMYQFKGRNLPTEVKQWIDLI